MVTSPPSSTSARWDGRPAGQHGLLDVPHDRQAERRGGQVRRQALRLRAGLFDEVPDPVFGGSVGRFRRGCGRFRGRVRGCEADHAVQRRALGDADEPGPAAQPVGADLQHRNGNGRRCRGVPGGVQHPVPARRAPARCERELGVGRGLAGGSQASPDGTQGGARPQLLGEWLQDRDWAAEPHMRSVRAIAPEYHAEPAPSVSTRITRLPVGSSSSAGSRGTGLARAEREIPSTRPRSPCTYHRCRSRNAARRCSRTTSSASSLAQTAIACRYPRRARARIVVRFRRAALASALRCARSRRWWRPRPAYGA